MKRIQHTPIGGLFVALILSLGLIAGCDSTPEPTPMPTPEPTVANTVKPTEQHKEIALVMGSWRTDDVEQMNRILAKFHEKYPNITVKFDPINPPEYNAVLQAQLEEHTGPDLFYLRSYSTSRELFEQGYLERLDDLPGLKEHFEPAMRAPWATDDGKPYGVPFIATSHGIYYNVDVFNTLNINVPTTWQELLDASQKIQDAGTTPFANASGDKWTMAEIVFMNVAPNFTGGLEGRLEYLTGKRCFNDAHMVAVFQAIKDIAPFLPDNQKLLTYSDSLQLFLQGKAAMWMGGSWDIPFFESEQPEFSWSVFAPPPPAGQSGYITFHLDAGMGLNPASQHKAEARTFLEWMTTSEFGELFANELPGFFPMHKEVPTLKNEHANAFLTLNNDRGTDVRFVWEKLLEGSPSGYVLIQNGAIAVLNGEKSPQQAADELQAGLAQWFEPAQKCVR